MTDSSCDEKQSCFGSASDLKLFNVMRQGKANGIVGQGPQVVLCNLTVTSSAVNRSFRVLISKRGPGGPPRLALCVCVCLSEQKRVLD